MVCGFMQNNLDMPSSFYNHMICDISNTCIDRCQIKLHYRECQWTQMALVKAMACHLFSAKPLPEPMLTYCQIDPQEWTSMKFKSKHKTFHSWKCIWKCRLWNGGHFVQGEMSQKKRQWQHWNPTLQWRHNRRDNVSNHQPHDCLLNSLFRRRSKKISKLRVTGLCAGNSPVTGEFPAQMASNAENISIWWRHHAYLLHVIVVWEEWILGVQFWRVNHSNMQQAIVYLVFNPLWPSDAIWQWQHVVERPYIFSLWKNTPKFKMLWFLKADITIF